MRYLRNVVPLHEDNLAGVAYCSYTRAILVS